MFCEGVRRRHKAKLCGSAKCNRCDGAAGLNPYLSPLGRFHVLEYMRTPG